jgi:hypothetical protein
MCTNADDTNSSCRDSAAPCRTATHIIQMHLQPLLNVKVIRKGYKRVVVAVFSNLVVMHCSERRKQQRRNDDDDASVCCIVVAV